MRTAWQTCVVGAAWMLHACAAHNAPIEEPDVTQPIQAPDPAETDRLLDATLRAGRSISLDADKRYEAALAALDARTDAAERLVARAEQAEGKLKLPYLILMGHVGLRSDVPRELLRRTALRTTTLNTLIESAPTRVDAPASTAGRLHEQDHTSALEQMLEQNFAAALALVKRGDRQSLLDVYNRGDLDVALVAAASAGPAGLIDSAATAALNARGITGSFASLGMTDITPLNVQLGPSPEPPVEGPI